MTRLCLRYELPWSPLSRAAYVGVVVGLSLAVAFAPFLLYAGVAVTIATSGYVQPIAGDVSAKVAGALAFLSYLIIVFGSPALVGGVTGALLNWLWHALRRDE